MTGSIWTDILLAVTIVVMLFVAVPFLIYLWSKAQMAGWLTTLIQTLRDYEDNTHKFEPEDHDKEEEA